MDVPGATRGGTTLTTSRRYNTVKDVEREVINARVWAGLHYRSSGKAGVKIGHDVVRWSVERYFGRVDSERDDTHEGSDA